MAGVKSAIMKYDIESEKQGKSDFYRVSQLIIFTGYRRFFGLLIH